MLHAVSIRWLLGCFPELPNEKNQLSTRYALSRHDSFHAVVAKLGVNYPPGIICDSSESNAEPKPHDCFRVISDHCDILRVIRHNRYFGSGNVSNKFGNHCCRYTDKY